MRWKLFDISDEITERMAATPVRGSLRAKQEQVMVPHVVPHRRTSPSRRRLTFMSRYVFEATSIGDLKTVKYYAFMLFRTVVFRFCIKNVPPYDCTMVCILYVQRNVLYVWM